nr:MAG TPA: hypothetical protein [Caudoviricetes sp.]
MFIISTLLDKNRTFSTEIFTILNFFRKFLTFFQKIIDI